jgi:hypothetical protein
MKTLVLRPSEKPTMRRIDRRTMQLVRDADLVVAVYNGLWSVWKDREGCRINEAPWDRLPPRIKAAIPLYPKDSA